MKRWDCLAVAKVIIDIAKLLVSFRKKKFINNQNTNKSKPKYCGSTTFTKIFQKKTLLCIRIF